MTVFTISYESFENPVILLSYWNHDSFALIEFTK